MTVPATENVASARSDSMARFEAVYDEHLSMLVAIAVNKFAVPPSDAQTLVHEVFLSYFMNMDDVRDVRSWLVGATCNACRMFIKKRERDVSVTDDLLQRPDPRNLRESLPDELACKEALSCLTARCQLALYMHYMLGFTIPEVADQLRITPAYAHKLVTRCMKQARERYIGKENT